MSVSTSPVPRQSSHHRRPQPGKASATDTSGFVPTLLDFTYTHFVRPRLARSADLLRRLPGAG